MLIKKFFRDVLINQGKIKRFNEFINKFYFHVTWQKKMLQMNICVENTKHFYFLMSLHSDKIILMQPLLLILYITKQSHFWKAFWNSLTIVGKFPSHHFHQILIRISTFQWKVMDFFFSSAIQSYEFFQVNWLSCK